MPNFFEKEKAFETIIAEEEERRREEKRRLSKEETHECARDMYQQMLKDAEGGKKTPLSVENIREILGNMEKGDKEQN